MVQLRCVVMLIALFHAVSSAFTDSRLLINPESHCVSEPQQPETPTLATLHSLPNRQSIINVVSLPNDCLVLSSEYLCCANDFDSFRRTSKRFDRIYEGFKSVISTKFRALDLLFRDNSESDRGRGPRRFIKKSLSMDTFLHSTPCILNVYMNFNDYDHSISVLFQFQSFRCHSKRRIVWGLTDGLNLPFISI